MGTCFQTLTVSHQVNFLDVFSLVNIVYVWFWKCWFRGKKIFLVLPNKGNLLFLNATNKYHGHFSHPEFCIKKMLSGKKIKLKLKDSTFLQAINLGREFRNSLIFISYCDHKFKRHCINQEKAQSNTSRNKSLCYWKSTFTGIWLNQSFIKKIGPR